MPPRFQVVLLDLDGTLVDSAEGLHAAASFAAETVGATPMSRTFVRDAIGRGTDRLLHRVCSGSMDGEVPPDRHQAARVAFDRRYATTCLTGTVLRHGVESALRTLRGEGRRLVVATNKPRRPARRILEHLGIDVLVDGLVCPEDVGVVKPDPAFIRVAAGDVGLDRVVLVGDSSVDAQSAVSAGIPFVAIRGGYDEGRDIATHDPAPAAVIESPGELPGAIRGLGSGTKISGYRDPDNRV